MLKRFIRVLLNVIASPITILLYLVYMVGTLIDVVIAPIEYIITGKTFADYRAWERPFGKPFDWFTSFIDNASYYIYCKISKDEYERDYWLKN